jgi:hypothetical protein
MNTHVYSLDYYFTKLKKLENIVHDLQTEIEVTRSKLKSQTDSTKFDKPRVRIGPDDV